MTRLDRIVLAGRAALAVSLFSTILPPPGLHAQSSTGRIVGRIVDTETGRGISDAGVQVVGTTMGVMSGVDGRYSLPGVPAGTVTLHVRILGYQPKTVTGLMLPAGESIEQDISMSAATVQLAATIVTAEAERGSVNAALDAQRTATGIVSAVTAEQISKSPDGDAAQAVQRISGVTVQDGRYVYVRGLGERYTTTSLNGTRIPSPDPERKVVPLDLFPAALLQTVVTSKTFTPDQSGDFSGAQVDIRTREFPASRLVNYSLSVGYNSAATSQSVLAAPTEGLEWLALARDRRALPGPLAAWNIGGGASQADFNRMVASFRNAWSARRESGRPNTSMGATLGGTTGGIGYIGSLSYAYSQEVRADEVRAYVRPGTVGVVEEDRFEGRTGRSSVLWGGLLNLSTMIGGGSRISFNNTYNRTADNEARSESGTSENYGLFLDIDRLRYVERTVRSHQLQGDHQLSLRHRFDWSISTSRVTRDEPDRSEIVYARGSLADVPALLNDPQSAVRTFSAIDEESHSGSGNFRFAFDAFGRQHELKVGGLARLTRRAARSDPFSLQANLSDTDRRLRPEQIFDGRYTTGSSAVFRVEPLRQGGSYDALDALSAGYAMIEYALSDRLRVIGGARVEHSMMDVEADPTVGARVNAEPTYTDVLPSAALNVRLSETQNLRLSVSQTLARPEYREIAEIQYREVLGGDIVQGNKHLKRTLIRNADIRWEMYPNRGEALSLALFGKRFEDPIERVYLSTSGSRMLTFINAESGTNYGVELEARKSLGFLANAFSAYTVFANATAMKSDVDMGGRDPRVRDRDRAMVGQAPYVVNAGLSYTSPSGSASATVLYNVVGRRIVSVAEADLPEVFEEDRNALDVSLRFPLLRGMSAKLDGKNLLDEPYLITQGGLTRESYRAGRVFSVGLSWRP